MSVWERKYKRLSWNREQSERMREIQRDNGLPVTSSQREMRWWEAKCPLEHREAAGADWRNRWWLGDTLNVCVWFHTCSLLRGGSGATNPERDAAVLVEAVEGIPLSARNHLEPEAGKHLMFMKSAAAKTDFSAGLLQKRHQGLHLSYSPCWWV